jgi:hypothetical protein
MIPIPLNESRSRRSSGLVCFSVGSNGEYEYGDSGLSGGRGRTGRENGNGWAERTVGDAKDGRGTSPRSGGPE